MFGCGRLNKGRAKKPHLILQFGFYLLIEITMSTQLDIYEVMRNGNGDIFTIGGKNCSETACSDKVRFSRSIRNQHCKCQCSPFHQAFREDLQECVHEFRECVLVDFVKPTMIERIPAISLPTAGQLLYPGAHLQFDARRTHSHRRSMTCKIQRTEALTSKGWLKLGADSPMFSLYEDVNKTFLQWIGVEQMRRKLQQRILLIRMNCTFLNRTFLQTKLRTEELCAAVRVAWVPGAPSTRYLVTGTHGLNLGKDESLKKGSGSRKVFVVSLSLVALAALYVLSLFVYLRTRREQVKKRCAYLGPGTLSEKGFTHEAHNVVRNNNLAEALRNIPTSNEVDYESTIGQSALHSTEYPNRTNRSASPSKSTGPNQDLTHTDIHTGANGEVIRVENRFPHDSIVAVGENSIRKGFCIDLDLLDPELLASPPLPVMELLDRIRESITAAKSRLHNFRYKPSLLVIPEEEYAYHSGAFRKRSVPQTQCCDVGTTTTNSLEDHGNIMYTENSTCVENKEERFLQRQRQQQQTTNQSLPPLENPAFVINSNDTEPHCTSEYHVENEEPDKNCYIGKAKKNDTARYRVDEPTDLNKKCVDRATKGLWPLAKLKATDWDHVCQHVKKLRKNSYHGEYGTQDGCTSQNFQGAPDSFDAGSMTAEVKGSNIVENKHDTGENA